MNNHYFNARMFHRLFWPAVIVGFCTAISDIVDSVTVGRTFSASGLAVIGVTAPLYMLFNLIGYAFSTGSSIAFSQLLADGKVKEAVRLFNGLFYLLLFISLSIIALGFIFMPQLLFMLGLSPDKGEFYTMSRQYLCYMLPAAPLFIFQLYFADCLRSDNNQMLCALSMIIGCGIDVTLNIILVLMLDWGITGPMVATIIAFCINIGIMLLHFKNSKHLLYFTLIRPDKALLKQCLIIIRNGLSTSIQELFQLIFELVANNMLIHLMADSSTLYVAVFNLILNVWYFTRCLSQAVVEAMLPLTSTFYAEHNHTEMTYTLNMAMKWGLGITMVMSALIAWQSPWITWLFGMSNETAVLAVRIFCISVIFDAGLTILAGYFQSIDEPHKSLLFVGLRFFIILQPLTILSCLLIPKYFWYAIPLTAIVSFVIAMVLLCHSLKQKNRSNLPIFSYTIENNNRDIGTLIERIVDFCTVNGANMKQINVVNMALEEVCTTIIQNAFTGVPNEFIQITVIKENDSDFVMHLRDDAESFNPFEVHASTDDVTSDNYMNSIGMMLIRKKAKQFFYRHYQGFNSLMLTV